MKKIILFQILILMVLGMNSQNIQDYYIVSKPDTSIEPTNKTINTDNTLSLSFESSNLEIFFNSIDVYKYEKAFPTSVTPYLQRVYYTSISGESYINELLNLNEIEYVEEIEQVELLYEPNDYNYEGNPMSQLELIRAPMAWEITTGNESAVIGISDSPPNINHEELNNKIIEHTGSTSTNFWAHGTMVAGCAAGDTDNGLGISSVGFNSKLFTNSVSSTSANQMLLLAQKPNVRVVNGSWHNSTCQFSSIENLIYQEIWNDWGVLPVFAAGNGGTCGGPTNYVYPASYDHTISVTSIGHIHDCGTPYEGDSDVTPKDVHEYYRAATGMPFSHHHNDKVDLCAPGYGVITTNGNNGYNNGSNGTSFAAPIVSGVAALVFSANPDLTPDEVKDILKNTSDDIYWMPENQPFIGLLGSGRVNAYRAVKEAKCLYDNDPDPDLDLYLRDSHEDLAVEPNNVSGNVLWHSPDIWVRNQQDGKCIVEHENPEYDPNGNSYVYVRVRNTSCETANGNNELKLYWAKANTSLSWPDHWDGSLYMYNPYLEENVLMGAPVATVGIPELTPGQETILEIPWNVPDPVKYRGINPNIWHFCLLARVESTKDPMTFPETENLPENVKNNNNIAWKNTSIVDVLPNNDATIGGVIAVGNPSDEARVFKLELVQDDAEVGKAIYEEAEVGIEMDSILYDAWVAGGETKTYFNESTLANKKTVSDDNAILNNIQLEANEIGTLYISFNFLTKEVTEKANFIYHVIQRDAITNEIIGGETFEIRKQPRNSFDADAGSDQEIDKFETVTISADDINEAAVYNWYDPEGNLIYTGQELTVSPDITKIYKLEIITDVDGYKDYDEIEVTVNPYAIDNLVPNPADNLVSINYKAQEAVSAYLMIINPSTGTSDNYILDTTVFETTLDISTYPAGLYHISLVCDGELVDTKNLIIE